MYRISVAGHFCVDLYPELPASARLVPGQLSDVGPLRAGLGGCVPNTGLALHDLGASVDLQATAGDDWLGRLGARLLAGASGRGWTPDIVSGVGSSYTLVLEPGGADRTLWHHAGVNAVFDVGRLRVDTDLLHFGYPPLLPSVVVDDAAPVVSLFDRARQAGATTSLDLAMVDPDGPVGGLDWSRLLDRMLAVTDIVSPSVDDLRSMLDFTEPTSLELAGRLCDHLLGRGAAIAMVTAGEHGLALRTGNAARLRSGGRVLHVLGEEWAERRVETQAASSGDHATSTGAGDAASAGLLYAVAAGLGPQEAARLAVAAAAALMSGERPTPEVVAGVDPSLAAVFGVGP